MKKRILSVVLSLCLALSCAAAAVFTTNAVETEQSEVSAQASESVSTDYGLADDVQDGQILQCFNWSYNNIKANMKEIAEQGFSAVQTSPIQTIKESTIGKTMTGSWWVMYQPSNFTIDDSGQSALGTKSEFEAMCTEAHKYGVKVIVDAVLNHMANSSSNDLSSTIPEEIRTNSSYWHDITTNSWYASRYDITQYCMGGVPDLNTANTDVQNYAISFLEECIDAGADGFRFDGAKHIETPVDSGCSSDFWPNVTSAVTSYAQSTRNITPYYYGEVLDKATGSDDTSNGQTVVNSYTTYMSITLSSVSNGVRNSVNSGSASGAIRSDFGLDDGSSISGTKAVLWNESHDTYQAGTSNYVSDANINQTWALVGTRAQACGMYLARPSNFSSDTIGTAGVTAWDDESVKAINRFKNAFIGETEYLSYSGSVAYNERGTSGVVIVNCASGSTSVSLTAHKMADGIYTDQITGNTFTVSGGTISGTVGSTGIAVVYNAETGPSASVTPGTSSYKTDTLTLTLNYKNATAGYYSIDGGSYTSFTDGDTITIGSDLDYGTKTTVSVKATDGTTTSDVETYTYTKKDPSEVQRIYFDNSSYGWSSVYAYIYSGSTENADWPGEAMTYDSSTGYYVIDVDDTLADGYVIFTESYSATTNRYPADGETGLSLEGTTKLFKANNTFVDYTPSTTTAASTTASTAATTSPSSGSVLLGDVNVDGRITISDATEVQMHLARMKTLTGDALTAADTDQDGSVSIKDVTAIQCYLVDLTSGAGYCGTYVDGSTDTTASTAATTASTTATSTTSSSSDTYTMTFTNSLSWSGTIYCYYWATDDTTLSTWPGDAMTKSSTDSDGNAVYTIEIPSSATNVIFTNGTYKTVDISISGSAAYCPSGTTTGGAYNVTKVTSDGTEVTESTTASSNYTMTFTNTLSWSGTIYCYYWSTYNTTMSTWPGDAMTKSSTDSNGNAVYTIEIPSNATNVIFTNGTYQTVDISISGSAAYYPNGTVTNNSYSVTEGTPSSSTEATEATEATTSSGSYTITFKNSLSWSGTIYCYYWATNDTTLSTWPGDAMTKSSTDSDGNAVYTIEIPGSATNVIFTNGSSQTVDISITGSTKYYAKSSTSNGKYEVGTWT